MDLQVELTPWSALTVCSVTSVFNMMAAKVDVCDPCSSKRNLKERRDLAFELEEIFKEISNLEEQIRNEIVWIQCDYRESVRLHCEFITKQVCYVSIVSLTN